MKKKQTETETSAITVTTKRVKLSEIRMNPDNPRVINNKEMANLVKSLQEFPEMMQLREIVVDETMTILGGNMRYKAMRRIGETECIVKIVTGLTHRQKREFVAKDNANFGIWDADALLDSWSDLPLHEWGLNLPENWADVDDDGKKRLTKNDIAEDKPELEAFIAARKKAKERGKDKVETNFWLCLVFQSYDQKMEFLKQFPTMTPKYALYIDGELFAKTIGVDLSLNIQSPIQSRLEKELVKRTMRNAKK